jgi:hypothetical protein
VKLPPHPLSANSAGRGCGGKEASLSSKHKFFEFKREKLPGARIKRIIPLLKKNKRIGFLGYRIDFGDW